jgi:hypothetical protein
VDPLLSRQYQSDLSHRERFVLRQTTVRNVRFDRGKRAGTFVVSPQPVSRRLAVDLLAYGAWLKGQAEPIQRSSLRSSDAWIGRVSQGE